MVEVGADHIKEIFLKEMGIKSLCVGDETIFTRSGGYLYLELSTEEE